MALPFIAALQGLAALPRLVDSVSALCDRIGSLERQINEKQVIERMATKRERNLIAVRAAINRVRSSPTGSGEGTD